MSKAHLPPVPPHNRNPHGGAQASEGPLSEADAKASSPTGRNLGQQGRQGNSKQNTTNQGHQQDR